MSECCSSEKSSCCCGSRAALIQAPAVSTSLTWKDILGAWGARWGIGRMNYKVEPGVYRVNKADDSSPVLVSANYKLTFDKLRKSLAGLDCWLLILDTKGINVWCAAGKGTFGTQELVKRIEQTGLAKLVSHRMLIIPQLGASGINAHEVTRRSGFSVIFGPVRAEDIKAFISAGYRATKKMRSVRFNFLDRLALTPMELVGAIKPTLFVFGAFFILNLFAARQFGLPDAAGYLGAVLAGSVATPLLLPFIPGKSFALKGALVGLLWAACAFRLFGWYEEPYRLLVYGYGLAIPAVSAFLSMNFTGSSTYTSASGVMREMRIAMPLIIVCATIGVVLVIIKNIIG